ncbi:iron-containing alcohol dehydrogenase [Halostella sp. JP-L12]|uniref:iron-containing alcohol dehydrogenase family protein n=1 Tax=Halostella TaxID=1843185 RepID=UPI000EF7F0DD|nr:MULTISPECIES: iron-containing alcohol dehydrogenase family protein [Halostella]NHN49452.1 iron-containing alcohol dehydrogenase [Halostella sp. JP-L12]
MSDPDDATVTERFEYDPGVIRVGRGSVSRLDEELDSQGIDRALVVCGTTVGSTPPVIDPVKAGLGETLAGVFDETTPAKQLSTAFDAAKAFRAADADAIVSLGGGSSLDTAKVASVIAAADRSREAIGREFAERGTITVPEGDLPPVAAVPTTLAGADLSQLAGITASPENGLVDESVGGGVGDPKLMPAAVVYDPDLFETTPYEVLAGSAMNGFDKGIETLYARNATPITDATAARGLSLLRSGLPALREDEDSEVMERVVEGILLVQYGISRPGETTLSLIHAFGHGLTAHSDVQQGRAHAIVAPHALRYLFDEVDGRRDLLADALGVPTEGRSDEAVAKGVVAVVEDVRDALDMPSRLRSIGDLDRADLDAVAQTTADDGLLSNAPAGLDPTPAELERVLDAAW